ncbi:MAG: hypothetical protein IPG10_01445 [Flavobacteriales bacterium]|nr:hypothetical protein [Flavobacteriales bacterium]
MRAVFLLPFVLAFLTRTPSYAQAGTLNTGFSGDGVLVWELSPSFDVASGVVVQPDGKIVATGRIDSAGIDVFLVCRLMPDGTPDPSFGIGGVSGTFLGNHETCQGYDIELQSTGAIVVAGIGVIGGPTSTDVVLARFLTDGTLDASFGNAGVVITDLGNGLGPQTPQTLRIMADDRIVLAGTGNGVPFVARFTANGVPDNTYGTGGVAWGTVAASVAPMAMRSEGSVVAGGSFANGERSVVVAFTADGLPDATFGNGGVDSLDVAPGLESIDGLDLLPDGRVAVCGIELQTGQPGQPFIALLGVSGGLDPSFGINGVVNVSYPGVQTAQASDLIVSPDGKILVSGYTQYADPAAANDFFLYRLLQDGTFDPSFALGGQVSTDVSTNYDVVQHMALAPNGSIVLTGYAADGQQTGGAYACYLNDSGTGVINAAPAQGVLAAFPNPAMDCVTVDFSLREAGRVSIALIAADGHSGEITDAGPHSAGTQRCTIPLPADLASGPYIARISTPLETLHTTIVVVGPVGP